MIFNKSVFKKLLKEAYKSSGLLVANKNGRIVLSGSWWVMTMANEVVEQLLDSPAALEDESDRIDGPYTRTPKSTGMLYWYTGECSFAACPIKYGDSVEEFIEEVQKVDIPQSKR